MARLGRIGIAAAGLVVVLGAACAGSRASGGPPAELVSWAAGPVRWYLLPAELREIHGIRTASEAVNFIERFWRLRDPDPDSPENALREAFASRVEAADLLYGEGELRGCLTDRGRALILLGPPVHLQVGSEPVLTWGQGRRADRVTSREVPFEVWRYPLDELPPRLSGALRARGVETDVELRFHLEEHAELTAGAEILELVPLVVLAGD